ncbi:MAG: hypothetical protein ACTHOI_11310 [Sphingomicrobium sp.]
MPPPVSLIPRRELLLRLRPPLGWFVLPELPELAKPPVSSLWLMPLEPMFSVHSPIWSLRLLIWSLICERFDHRKRPAAAAPAATAAAATGRSRAKSITPPDQSLLARLLLLRLFPPRLVVLGMLILLFE